MTTDTLVANILADADAELARNQRLLDEVALLRRTLNATRSANTRALRRAQTAEAVSEGLRQENERLRDLNARLEAFAEPHTSTAEPEPEPTNTVFALEYLELIRAHKLVKQLYAAPDGQYAAVANRMLAMFSEICSAVEPKVGKGKRDAA